MLVLQAKQCYPRFNSAIVRSQRGAAALDIKYATFVKRFSKQICFTCLDCFNFDYASFVTVSSCFK